MKAHLISTPVHDALGITANTAAVEAEIKRIADIRYDSFVHDVDVLTVAIYASHPSICAQYLKCPIGDFRRTAAEKAKALHFTPSQVHPLARQGFFCEQLQILLEIACSNDDYAAKLAQVFLTMLEHQEEHHLGQHLVGEIQRHLAMWDFACGFTIFEQNDNEIFAVRSVWGGA